MNKHGNIMQYNKFCVKCGSDNITEDRETNASQCSDCDCMFATHQIPDELDTSINATE